MLHHHISQNSSAFVAISNQHCTRYDTYRLSSDWTKLALIDGSAERLLANALGGGTSLVGHKHHR
jgi:hypothetical protein